MGRWEQAKKSKSLLSGGIVNSFTFDLLLCCFSSLQPSLFPVLLLLSRLYPSPLDEANSPISMKPFLPLLIRSANSLFQNFAEGDWAKSLPAASDITIFIDIAAPVAQCGRQGC